MSFATDTIVFLVGLGAPIEIYSDLINCVREQIPHHSFHILEWWSQDDFGKKELNSYIQNTSTLLIGHSAGGAIALRALINYPDMVERVVMLDSHTLKGMKSLPSVEMFLDILLRFDSEEVNKRVRNAYESVVKDSTSFDRSLRFLSEWVKNDLLEDLSTIEAMPGHRVLHIGFTDSEYKMLDTAHEQELKHFWGQHHIDTQFIPMSHFDLIMPNHAHSVIDIVFRWLDAGA